MKGRKEAKKRKEESCGRKEGRKEVKKEASQGRYEGRKERSKEGR